MIPQKTRPLPLAGVLQHYAWGGYDYLARLLGEKNEARMPNAELWMGTHPKGPAKIVGTNTTLDQLLERAPALLRGSESPQRKAAGLPFLLKVLDVRDMLSIQVHPDKASAEAGFAREEQFGPARTAPSRNYRDNNHKPELGVALSDFYLLHGFRSVDAIAATCRSVPSWQELLSRLEENGFPGLYRYIMEADQETVDELLSPLVSSLEKQRITDRQLPEFWTQRAVESYSNSGHHDRGIFSIFWMNIVHLKPGEGIFQDAGVPHAYLEGTCIELMANSDNVLRGGLTPKHIDVPELLMQTKFTPVNPWKLHPQKSADGQWSHYDTPAPDFRLLIASPAKGEQLSINVIQGPALLFLLEGEIRDATTNLKLDRDQRIAFVPYGCSLNFDVSQDAVVYLANSSLLSQ